MAPPKTRCQRRAATQTATIRSAFCRDTRGLVVDRGLRRPAIRKSRLREPADIPISAAKVARDDRTLRPEQPSLPTLIRQAVIAMTAMTAMIGGA